MDSIKNNNHVIVFLLLAINHICFVPAAKGQALPEFNEWHVSIVNSLSNDSMLFVRCQSKDNDLGIHNLSTGTNLTWSFRQNFFRTTLFWCYARKDAIHAAFKAFWKDELLFYKCLWKDCIWVAKDDGIYIKDLDVGCDELRHNWEPGW